MYCNHPVEVFYGSPRTIAALILMTISLLSIVLHVLFILASRKLAGWNSDFAFTLLIGMSCCSLVRFILEIVCDAVALTYVDFCSHHHLFTFLGAIELSSYLTLILLSVLITIHRIIYTIFATKAASLLPPAIAKTTVFVVAIISVVILCIVQSDDVHYHYVPPRLYFDDLAESTSHLLRLTGSLANYSLGVTNLIAYPIIFLYLHSRHSLSFTRNDELRMTIQVTLFVIIECIFFVYWEFIENTRQTTSASALLTSSIIKLVFYDSIIFPYLLINKRVQNRIVDIVTCRSTSRQPLCNVIVYASG
ncbi:hypothetical protein GCK32_008962 [Trichostrongylus colubriformis]|uniref:G protein-coupled receptor n=1 Tax=Trichostrongylus colubriformis TaxID=6319 RepID=A0AAN8FDS1_TRICO